MNRFFRMVLCLALCLTCLTASAFAATVSGGFGGYTATLSGNFYEDEASIYYGVEEDFANTQNDQINTDTETIITRFSMYIEGEYSDLEASFSVPESNNGKKAYVIWCDDFGSVKVYESGVIDGTVTINPENVGYFAVAISKNETIEDDGFGDDFDDGFEDIPQTGDSSMPILWAGMVLAALIVFANRKRILGR